MLLLCSHIENHLFQAAVQLAARREASLHKLTPIRFALHHFLRSLWRNTDIPPAGVLAQTEDIVQGHIKIGGIPDQDAVRRCRPVSFVAVDGSLIGVGQCRQLGLGQPRVLAQHAQSGAYGYIHGKTSCKIR